MTGYSTRIIHELVTDGHANEVMEIISTTRTQTEHN
jgi:hypothetical protein